MDLRNFEHSLWVGISFGLASGVLTSLGLLVGLAIGTKLVVASSFLVPVLLFELAHAVWVSVAWGMAAVIALSLYISRKQAESRMMVVAEHLGVAVLVVAASALVGRWVAATFA
jgi:hypothetical protein